ncbi:MAG: glycosyltransferase [Bacteroidales bacterium]|nr:glycosyltransferase [Bacteroidales bacterium]
MNSSAPSVSICCLAYNHAPFIRQCLNGFLMQETNFPIEVLIHDDASTDGTDDILREYQAKYPDKIFPIYEEQNKFSQGYRGRMDIEFNYSRAKGKYIAYCEGDDYWTDPHKLQRQVDFLESHPDYSICFHRCSHLNNVTGKLTPDNCGGIIPSGQQGVDITIGMFMSKWITQPLTMVFRRDKFTPDWQKQYKYYRDMHEIYHLLNVGKGYLFAFNGGVYRYHPGGVHSMISASQYCLMSLPTDEEFYRINPSPYSKRTYLDTLQECIKVYAGTDKPKALKYLFTHFRVSRNFRAFIKQLRIILQSKNTNQQ